MPDSKSRDAAEQAAPGQSGRVLLGWMERDEALRFLLDDCLFAEPLSAEAAEDIWRQRRAAAELACADAPLGSLLQHPLSAADEKVVQKFRKRFPDHKAITGFIRLNPLDLTIRRTWVSTAVADRYRDCVTPSQWPQTALLDPPKNSPRSSWNQGGALYFDLPHREFLLAGPDRDGYLRVSESENFVTVAMREGQAVLLGGLHRAFAAARYTVETPNAPRGILFAISDADPGPVPTHWQGLRPPRMADFFDESVSLEVRLRTRRFRLRISFDVREKTDFHADPGARRDTAPANLLTAKAADGAAESHERVRQLFDEATERLQAGKYKAAVELFERVLFLRPDYADAHSNLGLALVEDEDRIEEAKKHYYLALTIDPRHAAAFVNLGAALAKERKFDEAVVHYRRALEIEPHNVQARFGMANILQTQGQFAEAMEQVERALAVSPGYIDAYYIRATLKKFQKGDPDLKVMESLARRPDLRPKDSITVNYALGKAFQDAGDYQKAFPAFIEANRVKRLEIDYNEPETARLFKRIEQHFDRSMLERLAGLGDPSLTPIFIVGMPRSGSTLTEQVLASHPQICGGGELFAMRSAETEVFGSPKMFPEFGNKLDAQTLGQIGASYLRNLPDPGPGRTRIVDKMPANFMRIGLIRLMLPNARIIHTMRNAKDICVSCFTTNFSSGQYFSYDLAELGRYYGFYAGLMQHWREVLPPDAFLETRYEDMVEDLEGQARRIIDFCGLEWNDACLEFYKTKRAVVTASVVQVRQPIYRGSVERWRRYEPFLGPLIRELGEPEDTGTADPASNLLAAH